MRSLASLLLVLALLTGGARLFTGILYLSDEPTALFVLKHAPAGWIECPEAQDRPLSGWIVLDREEPSLAYGRPYVAVMRMAPVLAPLLAAAALLLLAIARRAGRKG